mmetsp:Transcript_6925/g.11069  ORF Transcript_6925/g.11069 Transcript_6925/m.11069 type:complete len:395 (+) Transcript_6925:360-1544(+)
MLLLHHRPPQPREQRRGRSTRGREELGRSLLPAFPLLWPRRQPSSPPSSSSSSSFFFLLLLVTRSRRLPLLEAGGEGGADGDLGRQVHLELLRPDPRLQRREVVAHQRQQLRLRQLLARLLLHGRLELGHGGREQVRHGVLAGATAQGRDGRVQRVGLQLLVLGELRGDRGRGVVGHRQLQLRRLGLLHEHELVQLGLHVGPVGVLQLLALGVQQRLHHLRLRRVQGLGLLQDGLARPVRRHQRLHRLDVGVLDGRVLGHDGGGLLLEALGDGGTGLCVEQAAEHDEAGQQLGLLAQYNPLLREGRDRQGHAQRESKPPVRGHGFDIERYRLFLLFFSPQTTSVEGLHKLRASASILLRSSAQLEGSRSNNAAEHDVFQWLRLMVNQLFFFFFF